MNDRLSALEQAIKTIEKLEAENRQLRKERGIYEQLYKELRPRQKDYIDLILEEATAI